MQMVYSQQLMLVRQGEIMMVVFRACRLGRWLDINGLNIPTSIKLPHDNGDIQMFPYYFVADEAFPLKSY
jgi:hypothetical protein